MNFRQKLKRKMKRMAKYAASIIAAGLVAMSPFAAPVASAESADAFTALAGVLGSFGMYGSYLAAILDAGDNSLYQEQTRVYDAQENGTSLNPNDHRLIDEIMTRLVSDGTYVMDYRSLPFTWSVNDSDEFNAACFPTDYVTVNRGIISGLNRNTDELAGVLAHEMTHGIRLHAAYTYARAAAQSFGVAFLSMATGAVRPDVAAVLADYSVAKNVILPAEYEADEGGFWLAASAGFNPGGSAAAMARMYYLAQHPETFDRSYGAEAYDHPDTDKREAKLAELMAAYSAGHVTVIDRKTIAIDGVPLVTATYSDESYDDTPENAYLIAGGLAKAFHDCASAAEWNFRAGENGRTDYLTDDDVYARLKDAVALAHAEETLRSMVENAYASEPSSGARMKLADLEAKESERLIKREQNNLELGDKWLDRFYHNADWYNDTYRPELAILEANRGLRYDTRADKKARLYSVRGRAKALMGDFDGALADANEGVNGDPKDAYTFLNRAEVWRAQGQPQYALMDIRRSLDADAKTMAAWKMAGDIEDELGDTAAATADYKKYLELAPKATDIPEEYLKVLAPDTWEKIEKAREEAAEQWKEEHPDKVKKNDDTVSDDKVTEEKNANENKNDKDDKADVKEDSGKKT